MPNGSRRASRGRPNSLDRQYRATQVCEQRKAQLTRISDELRDAERLMELEAEMNELRARYTRRCPSGASPSDAVHNAFDHIDAQLEYMKRGR
jgi:hypothetical protein